MSDGSPTSTITLPPQSVFTIPSSEPILPAFACPSTGLSIGTPPEANAVAIEPLYDGTYSDLQSCCNGAPIVAYYDGCAAYCTAQGQDVNELLACIRSVADEAEQTDILVECPDCGSSPSSTIYTNSTTTTNSGTGSVTVAATMTATPSSTPGAAADGLRESRKRVGKMALAVTAVLIGSVFAGVVML